MDDGQAGKYARVRASRRRVAQSWRPSLPVPDIDYMPEEDHLWQVVVGKLTALHTEVACAHYQRAAGRTALPIDRVPQLREVSARLAPATGFTLVPAAGIVPSRDLYSAFLDGVFPCTQYLRPVASLFHSPEPDVIHELVGHAAMLADPEFAELYRSFGRIARAVPDAAVMQAVSRLFWFSMENGVVEERGGRLRVYGAAILSSVSELETFHTARLRAFRAEDVVEQDFDDGSRQTVLFVVDSVAHLRSELDRYFATIRGDAARRRPPTSFGLGTCASR